MPSKHDIVATYKVDGSQKAERYVKFYFSTDILEYLTKVGGTLHTSLKWIVKFSRVH